jgi:hypothetical protein
VTECDGLSVAESDAVGHLKVRESDVVDRLKVVECEKV